jgi:hypothetical protein
MTLTKTELRTILSPASGRLFYAVHSGGNSVSGPVATTLGEAWDAWVEINGFEASEVSSRIAGLPALMAGAESAETALEADPIAATSGYHNGARWWRA